MTINFIAWHDRDSANHKKETDAAAAQGFRTVSLCVYGERSDPRFAAVMVKRPKVHASSQFIGDAGKFQQTFNEMSAKDFGPYIVSATGPTNNPLIAAVFRPMKPTPLTRFGITQQELAQLNLEAWRNGLIPVSIDAYGTPGDVRYIAVWHPNPARIAWNLEAVSDPVDLATRQARFNAITAQGGRPTFTIKTPDKEFLGMFVDNAVGSWASKTNLTSAEYQAEFDKQVAKKRAPICVTAQGTGANTRFSAIFVDREEPVARVFTPSKSTAAVAGIDSAMEKFIKDHSIHGCALAITLGTRLVYAKGYTNAEPGYTPVEPTTLFRIASVSKVFVTAAIYRLIQQGVKTPGGSKFTLDTTMQSVLDLKTPTGDDPVSPQFENIKIKHLLESTSALEQSLMWRHVEAAQAFGSNKPCTPAQLASLCAATALQKDPDTGIEKTPGDTTNVFYGNTDYFLLSQVVARLSKTETFEEALDKLILKPLKIKRVRGSRSLQTAQESDEARYHTTNINPEPKFDEKGNPGGFTDYPPSLWISPSWTSPPDFPLAPHQYGADNYEILDGCGGLSGAVTDIARLMAALSLRKNNPVFSEATLDNWFQNVLTATGFTGPDDHGLHGFDWANVWDLKQPVGTPGNFVTSKGGWLPSHSTMFTFTAGGLGFVVATNNGGQADIKTDWYMGKVVDNKPAPDSVLSVAFFHDWGTIDLFPQFGMSSFQTKSFRAEMPKFESAKFFTFSKKLRDTSFRVRNAITRQRTESVRRKVGTAAKK